MRLALAFLAALTATPALADAVTYRGTIGTRDVVIELTEPSDGAVAGRFAFMDEGKSIPLNAGSNTATTFVLSEEGKCTADICTFDEDNLATSVPAVAHWELTLDGTTLTGTRKGTGKSKDQAVTAEEIGRHAFTGDPTPETLRYNLVESMFADSGPFDPATSPFEMAVADGPLVEDRRFKLGDAVVGMMVDPRSQFAFPRVIEFADGADTGPVNAILYNEHIGMTAAALDCLSSGYVGFGANEWTIEQGSLGDYDSENIELTYATPLLVSWVQSGSLWCGGAHPYNHIDSYTSDPATGQPLDLSLIFSGWTPVRYDETPVDLETARATPDDVSWQPDDKLIAYVKENIPADLSTDEPELDEACFGDDGIRSQLDIRFEDGPNAVFTLSGFPHVIGVCNGNLFSTPLAELGQFLTPEAKNWFPELN